MASCRQTSGRTVLEVVIVAVLVVILSALLGAGIVSVRRSSKNAVCLDNLRRIGRATVMYAGDFDDCLPPYALMTINKRNSDGTKGPKTEWEPDSWKTCLSPYLMGGDPFYCPFDEYAGSTTKTPGYTEYDSLVTSYEHTPWLVGVIEPSGLINSTLALESSRQCAFLQDRFQRVFDERKGAWVELTSHGERMNVWFLSGEAKNISVN